MPPSPTTATAPAPTAAPDPTAVPLRNVAIIAHVDHGKTTLLDGLLWRAGTFRENQQVAERVMDRLDLERERGITIQAKNCALQWRGMKVNVVDTPGHADFGGEVERTLHMVDGALLLVDAAEGPLPQTRFVVRKALARGLRICVVVNKIDRKDARPHVVHDAVFDLLVELGAQDWQLDFPCVFASAIERRAVLDPTTPGGDLGVILDLIVDKVPAPRVGRRDEPLQHLVCDLSRTDYLGRLAVGRIQRGTIRANQDVLVCGATTRFPFRVTQVLAFRGLEREPVAEAGPGEIVAIAGAAQVGIGDTITDVLTPDALPRLTIDEPVLSLEFHANTSPFSGRSGKYVTARHIRERLEREVQGNPAIRLEETDRPEVMRVAGRGELQLGVLIETMRREGYELAVSRPEVILKEIGGKTCEPYERVTADIPDHLIGAITEFFAKRRGRMLGLDTPGHGRARVEIRIPSRGLLGLRTRFRVLTAGEGLLASELDGWEPYGGEIRARENGALVADREGKTTKYALKLLEDRGIFFVGPRTPIYRGMVVGEHSKENDLWVHVGREKHLSNVRAAGADEAVVLEPHRELTLEQALEYLAEDELCEVTPDAFRIRKRDLGAGPKTFG